MKVTVVTTGDAELNRKLATLAGPDQKKAVKKASRVALRPVLQQVRSNAPRRTGFLSRSAKIRAITRSRSRIGSRVTVSGSNNAFKGKGFYGGFQEYGWRAGRRVKNSDVGLQRGARRSPMMRAMIAAKNNSRPQIAGKHFMKRAAESKKDEALASYKSEMKEFVRGVTRS